MPLLAEIGWLTVIRDNMKAILRMLGQKLAMASLVVGLTAGGQLRATSTTAEWANLGTDFNTAGNWTGGAPSLSVLLRFASANPTYQPTLSAAAEAAGLEFTSTAGAFTLSGNSTLTIGDEGIKNSSAALQTIAVALNFTSTTNYHWIINDGSMAITGSITSSAGQWLKFAGGTESVGTMSGVISGTDDVVKYGDGAWTFSGDNTFTGRLLVEGGTLVLSGTNATTTTQIDGGTLTLSNRFALQNSAVTLTANGTLTFDGLTQVTLGSLAASDTCATLSLSNGGEAVYGVALTVGGDNTSTTYAGSLTGSGSLIKTGTGSLTLSCSNTYTGGTTLSGGTLVIASDAALGDASGGLTFDGGALQATENLSTARSVLLTSNSGTIDTQCHDVTFSGQITGAGGLTKLGSGKLTLTAANSNSYAGTTTVSAGTLKVGATNALPTDSLVSLASGSILEIAANQTIDSFLDSLGASVELASGQTLSLSLETWANHPTAYADHGPYSSYNHFSYFAGVMSGEGALEVGVVDGYSRGLVMTGENTYTGGTTINASSALQLGNGGTSGMIVGDVVNDGRLIFQRSDDVSYSGTISGSGAVSLGRSLANVGGGDVELTAANTYTGGTTVYGGALVANNTTGSATGTGDVTVYAGYLAGIGAISGNVSLLSGASIAPGTGEGYPGTLTIGSGDFSGGSIYVFQITDANGVVGSDLSLLNISGVLAFTASVNDPFIVQLVSIDSATSTQGTLAYFDATQAYRWEFVNASGGITGFSSSLVTVDTSNFANAFTGTFSVTQSGSNLFLEYTPAAVPEPSTWALLATGAGVLLLAERRRRQGLRR